MLRAVLMTWVSAVVRAGSVVGLGEESLGLFERGVWEGNHQIGWGECVVGHGLAGGADGVREGGQRRGELLLVTTVDGVHDGGVQLLERRSLPVGDRVLPFAQDPDDHDAESLCSAAPSSAAGGAPAPTSAFSAASSASTVEVVEALLSWAWMSSTGLVRSVSAPEASSSSMAPARACMPSILSWALCIDMPASLIDAEMPDTASPILVWASAAV